MQVLSKLSNFINCTITDVRLQLWGGSDKKVLLTDRILNHRFTIKTRSELHASPKLI